MAVKLEDLSAVYSQDGDCCGGEEYQDLEIKTQDGGGGIFYVIKTERWAFENIEEIKNIIQDFEKRFNLTTKLTKRKEGSQ